MLKLKFELISKALLRSKSFSLIFIANFTLAIFSLTFLQFFKSSIETSLDSKSKSLLGADISISSRFPISKKQEDNILKLLPKVKRYVKSISTVSMISSNSRSRLMEIAEIQKDFPYYGNLTFSDNELYPGQTGLLSEDEIWVHIDAQKILDLKIGETLKVGTKNFTITKVVRADGQKTTSFSGFMPKIYLSKKGLERSELIQFGSTARYKFYYLLQEELTNDQLEVIENKLEKKVDRNLRVLSPNDGRDRLTRVLSFMTNFLSLVSLVSFFLGLVGLIYLYSGFLGNHKKDMKILNDLGIGKKDLCITYLLHLITLILLSSIVVFSLTFLLGPSLEPIIKNYIDFNFTLTPDYGFFIKSFLILIILSISVGLPLILPLLDYSIEKKSIFKSILSFTPFIIVLLCLGHFVTPMKMVGLGFSIVIFLIILGLFALGNYTLKKLDFSGHTKNLAISLAIKNVVRQKKNSLTLFTAIILCVSLFSLIPQVGSSLSKTLSLSVENKPRFFVIDAKREHIKDLTEQVTKLGGKLENISPMVRGRIVKVNDLDFREHSKNHAKNLEDSDKDELKNRAVNLSFRSGLKKTEKIMKGREFSGRYQSKDYSVPVEVSVEQRFAKRRGLKVGDRLTFDVLGLELPAKVINIRAVKWTDFVPNFFLILQDGAINKAPNTILATISYGDYDPHKFILRLSDLFPALTIIDVKNIFEEFSKLVSIITSITDRMSIFSILIGLIMSFIIIQYQMNLQKNNILRLKMIGINNEIIKKSLLLEYGIISMSASFLGILMGSLGSYLVAQVLFESYWSLRPILLSIYFLVIPLLTMIIVTTFTSRIISQKENKLFSE